MVYLDLVGQVVTALETSGQKCFCKSKRSPRVTGSSQIGVGPDFGCSQKWNQKRTKVKGVSTLDTKIARTHSHYRFWSELPTQNYSHYRFWSKTSGKGVNPKAKCDHIFTSLTTLLLRSVQIAPPFINHFTRLYIWPCIYDPVYMSHESARLIWRINVTWNA